MTDTTSEPIVKGSRNESTDVRTVAADTFQRLECKKSQSGSEGTRPPQAAGARGIAPGTGRARARALVCVRADCRCPARVRAPRRPRPPARAPPPGVPVFGMASADGGTAEEWRPAAGVDSSKLLVSNLGNVLVRQSPGHWAAPAKGSIDPNGYCHVVVDRKRLLIHRMVCEAWHGPCPSEHSCDHINGDRADNRVENLRWLDAFEQRMNQKPAAPKQWKEDDNQEDLPDEEWRSFGIGMRLSNMGRVQFKKIHHSVWSGKRTLRPAAGMPYARVNNMAFHRLVYKAFNGPIPAGYSIDHIDQDKTNNKLSNLRALTPKEQNMNRTFKCISKRQTSLKKPVRAKYGLDNSDWETFDSLGDAIRCMSKRHGLQLKSGCASLVAQGKQRHHHKVCFEYV